MLSVVCCLLFVVSSLLKWIQREIAAFGGDPSQVRREKGEKTEKRRQRREDRDDREEGLSDIFLVESII